MDDNYNTASILEFYNNLIFPKTDQHENIKMN